MRPLLSLILITSELDLVVSSPCPFTVLPSLLKIIINHLWRLCIRVLSEIRLINLVKMYTLQGGILNWNITIAF